MMIGHGKRVSRLGGALALLAAVALLVVPARGVAAQQATKDLFDTIDGNSDLSTFGRALRTAGLVDTLKGTGGPYTVWAPTNSGFNKLPSGQLDDLMANPDQLRKMMTYHIGRGPITAAQIVQVPSVVTLEGEPIRVSASGNAVHLNDATVTQADVLATNGIIHVIDSVLVPPSGVGSLPATGEADSPVPLLAALAAVGLLLAGAAVRLASPAARGRPRA
jgi:LPXTG-motif cell wall-anchored protein